MNEKLQLLVQLTNNAFKNHAFRKMINDSSVEDWFNLGMIEREIHLRQSIRREKLECVTQGINKPLGI